MSDDGKTNARRRHSDATFSIVAAPSNCSSIALNLAETRTGLDGEVTRLGRALSTSAAISTNSIRGRTP